MDASKVAELKKMAALAEAEIALLPAFVKMAGQKQMALLINIIKTIEAL
jgi:hypothetical protein